MSDHEEFLVPLQDQRVFGAGVKRKRVNFVPASSSTDLSRPANHSHAADRYLAIVLGEKERTEETKLQQGMILDAKPSPDEDATSKDYSADEPKVCEVCNLPVEDNAGAVSTSSTSKLRPHEASLVHQLCLPHSHPPSNLDRSRQGLRYLSSYGWDPDGRQGLGARGEGIKAPIKVRMKLDTVGLGADIRRPSKMKLAIQEGKKAKETLDAGKIRKMEAKSKERNEKLRQMFYSNVDVDRYLGA